MRKGPQHNTASLLHIVLELLTALFESIADVPGRLLGSPAM